MRILTLLAALVAVTVLCSSVEAQVNISGLNRTKARFSNGRVLHYDADASGELESILPVAPVYFYDDFMGYKLNKYTTGENTSAPWLTIETSLNTAAGLATDLHAALIQLDSDSNTERGVLYFGDQECFDGYSGIVFEARIKYGTPTESAEIIVGLAGADNATADTVDVNAWFRILAAAPTALLWETDDNVTNDDDNAAATVAQLTWYTLRIELDVTSGATFYVDGVKVGNGTMAGLTTTTGMVQPYFAVQKGNDVGIGALYIDYVRIWGNR